jgi:hypothetical protein
MAEARAVGIPEEAAREPVARLLMAEAEPILGSDH